ncbi:dienelactone hydrolase family protein [Fimbriimonas ginsengisoli]|nr:dienelactone hydrolase family protein [Fimbriimonas ginsengisoli]
MIKFSDGSHEHDAYLSPSKTGKGPGVIVIQEWWGLVDHIKRVCDRFADEGFTALAPDLYHGKSTKEPDEAASMMQALNIAHTEAILRKAIMTLMVNPATEGEKIGVVGFCMGGQLALFAAGSNPVIKACVNFYGIHPNVEPSYRTLSGPVLGIFAEHDDCVDPELVKAMSKELTLLGKVHEFITYPGAQHAFFNDDRPEVYDAAAAADAWKRTIRFLKENLR